jgi:perosamine synthetase
MSRKIPLANPNVGEEEAKAVYEVVKSGWLHEGEKVKEFEDNFAEYIGVKHAIAVFNGTVGLHAILHALKIGVGDEVIVPSFTFISTANSVLFTGAKPVFADIDEKTFNINPDDVLEKMTEKTKAIMPVHYGGQPADMKPLMEIAEDYNLYLIEDAAEAHGAVYGEKKVGSFGIAAMFSFTPTKNITTGEGGMITTNDDTLAKTLRLLKDHGQIGKYKHIILGFNYRMTEMQGAIGVVQLKKLDGIITKKRVIANRLSKGLSKIKDITPPYVAPDRTHVYMMYTIKVGERAGISRDELMKFLDEKGIATKIYFPPIHLQPYYKSLGFQKGLLPVTEEVHKQILSLPCYAKLTEGENEYILDSINEALTY